MHECVRGACVHVCVRARVSGWVRTFARRLKVPLLSQGECKRALLQLLSGRALQHLLHPLQVLQLFLLLLQLQLQLLHVHL